MSYDFAYACAYATLTPLQFLLTRGISWFPLRNWLTQAYATQGFAYASPLWHNSFNSHKRRFRKMLLLLGRKTNKTDARSFPAARVRVDLGSVEFEYYYSLFPFRSSYFVCTTCYSPTLNILLIHALQIKDSGEESCNATLVQEVDVEFC